MMVLADLTHPVHLLIAGVTGRLRKATALDQALPFTGKKGIPSTWIPNSFSIQTKLCVANITCYILKVTLRVPHVNHVTF